MKTLAFVLAVLASCDKGVTITASGVNDRAHCVVDINAPEVDARADAPIAKTFSVPYPVFVQVPAFAEKP